MAAMIHAGIDLSKHQGIVHMVVQKFRWALRDGLQYEDLVQVGNEGLMRAAETFDDSLGYKFPTYGTYWVRACVRREVDDRCRTIRIPSWVRREAWKNGTSIPSHGTSLDTSHGFTGGGGALSGFSNVLMGASQPHETLLDSVSDEAPPAAEEQLDVTKKAALCLEKMRALLTDQEFTCVYRKHVKDESLTAIGRDLGVSREWVRLLVNGALKKVRAEMSAYND